MPSLLTWTLLYDVVERLGASQGSVDALARRARDSGLEVVETSGFFQVIPAQQGFDLHASTIAAAKSRAIQSGVASGDEIDALERVLRNEHSQPEATPGLGLALASERAPEKESRPSGTAARPTAKAG